MPSFRRIIPVIFLTIYLCIFCLYPTPSVARNTGVSGYNVQLYFPAIDPKSMWQVNTTNMLEPGQFYFLADTHLSGGELSVVNSGVLIKLTDKLLTTNFLVSLGITDFVMVGVDLPVTFFENSAAFALDFTVINPQPDTFDTQSFGDIRLFTKWRFWKDEPNTRHPGIGLLLYTTLPTGDEYKFLGNTGATYGGSLIIDKKFRDFTLAVNLGMHFIPEKNALGTTADDRFTYGFGILVPAQVFKQSLELIVDIKGEIQVQNPQELTSPLEFHMGVRKHFDNGLSIALSGGGDFYNAIGNPDYRGNVTLSWKFPTKEKIQQKDATAREPQPKLKYAKSKQKLVKYDIYKLPKSKKTAAKKPKKKTVKIKIAKKPKKTHKEKKIARFKVKKRKRTKEPMIVSALYFKKYQSTLSRKQIHFLREFAAFLKQKKSKQKIILQAIDKDFMNGTIPGWLPYYRLLAIKQTLIKFGIPRSRVIVEGIADTDRTKHKRREKHVNIMVEG